MAQEEPTWPRETDLDSVWSHQGCHLLIRPSTFTCGEMAPIRAARRRHSPGKGTLKPDPVLLTVIHHLVRVGRRRKLNQAPSLGTAKPLEGISGVERRSKEGEAGPSHGSSVCLGISANPRPILPESQPLPCASRSLPILQVHAQSLDAFGFYERNTLAFALVKNQNGSRRQELPKAC